ncbi:MAG: hypothetical protein IJ196_05360 [Prevotella sp.]|nr:hypothetical protein [Prevotella sp.]
MKKNIIWMALLMGGWLFTACGGSDAPDTPDNPGTPDKPVTQEWNKENTLNVCYITSLSEASSAGNVEKAADYLKAKGCTPAIVDRTDVLNYADQSACQNTSTQLSFLSAKFCSFVMEGYKGNDIQGSTVVLGHKINTVESETIGDGCFMQYVKTQGKSIAKANKTIVLPLAMVKISAKEQVAGAVNAVKKFSASAYKAVVVGEVKTSIADDLKAQLATLPAMKLTLVEPAGEYTIFMTTGESYILRSTATETVGTQTAYTLSIEEL